MGQEARPALAFLLPLSLVFLQELQKGCGFPFWAVFLPRVGVRFATLDIWLCLETCWLSHLFGAGGFASGIWWVEAGNAAKRPAMHRTAPLS